MSQSPSPNPSEIRAYCDGELDADRARALERRAGVDPDLAAGIRFEQALRARVERALSGSSAAPAEVRARIRAVLAETPGAETPVAEPAAAGPAATRRASPAARTGTGPKANIFAIAASLALVAGAVLFGIFGKPIDRLNAPTSLLADVAEYASDEHRRCSARPEARQKLVWATEAAAEPHLEGILGAPVSIDELGPAGYRFVGATVQELPGHPVAAHLLYAGGEAGEDGCPEALFSVFVVPNAGQFDAELRLAPWQWATAGDRPECSKRVLASSDGSLVYFLVCCNESRIGMLAAELGP